MVLVLASQLSPHSSPSPQTPQFYQVISLSCHLKILLPDLNYTDSTPHNFQILPWRASSVLGAGFCQLEASKKRFGYSLHITHWHFQEASLDSAALLVFFLICFLWRWLPPRELVWEQLCSPTTTGKTLMTFLTWLRLMWKCTLQKTTIKSSKLHSQKLRSSPSKVGKNWCFCHTTNCGSRSWLVPLTCPIVPQVFLLRAWHFRAVMWMTLQTGLLKSLLCVCGDKSQNFGCGGATWNILLRRLWKCWELQCCQINKNVALMWIVVGLLIRLY